MNGHRRSPKLRRGGANFGRPLGSSAVGLHGTFLCHAKRAVDFRQGQSCICHDRQASGKSAHELFGIDVDAHELVRKDKRLGIGVHLGLAEFSAHCQHGVGLTDGFANRLECHILARAQRITGRQNALGVDRIDDGSVEVFGESERFSRPCDRAATNMIRGFLAAPSQAAAWCTASGAADGALGRGRTVMIAGSAGSAITSMGISI